MPEKEMRTLGQESGKMNPYDKLEHEQRAWSVSEAAAFLGYSVKHLYRLIRENKIEGWIKVEGGGYIICPVKLKAWMERRFNGKPSNSDASSPQLPRKDGDDEAV